MEPGRLLPGVGPEHIGVRVGTCAVESLSGVTALIPPAGSTVGVDSRGGGPATHETDIARPGTLPFGADGIVLTGGSALGLACARGVQDRLVEAGVGTPVAGTRVPIVPAAAIFDIGRGGPPSPPSAPDGYRAADNALNRPAATAAALCEFRGSAGAGIGAWTGRGFCRGGMGCASILTADGQWVSAVVIANPMGTVFEPDGRLAAAGVLSAYGLQLPSADPEETSRMSERARQRQEQAPTNTTIAVICTDASLTDSQTTRLAASAHAGIARAVWPSHTMFDGDTVFALSTGQRPGSSAAGAAGDCAASVEMLTRLNIAAADALSAAIVDAVLTAGGQHCRPASADLPPALADVFPQLYSSWSRHARQRLDTVLAVADTAKPR
ncbi:MULTISPECIES: P1 family peptidase [unclassified Brevibacterium]|uniref:P1 family peptidase n=1 Tax=unclassified Brevibacterium TaxID=2614124 RepID=UPI0008A46202|nr:MULTISPECIES: P1 family peptidase [unclassified Brevibacterium]OFL65241.1 hypothetical protein HMPREF2757_05040 [Brevibacterium sp. HMSC063G07]